MNMFARFLVCGVLLAMSAGRAYGAEAFFLIRVTDMCRENTTQVMSADEFKQFQKLLQQEERFFKKAEAQALEEWRKDEMNKTTPFPMGKVVPRKILGQPERFDTREKAEARVTQYEDREARKRDREADKSGGKNMAPAQKAKYDREIDLQLTVRRAADLVAAKLAALMEPGAAPAAEPAAKEKEPAVKEKDAGAALKKAL